MESGQQDVDLTKSMNVLTCVVSAVLVAEICMGNSMQIVSIVCVQSDISVLQMLWVFALF